MFKNKYYSTVFVGIFLGPSFSGTAAIITSVLLCLESCEVHFTRYVNGMQY